MRPIVFPPKRLAVLILVSSALLAGFISTTRASNGSGAAPLDLVFQSDRDGNLEIYAMRSDGHLQRRLTVEPSVDRDPAVDPNGLVAFASDRGGDLDLFVMNSEGRAVTRLTALTGDETQPAFSPDGSKLAFVHGGDVFVMSANGSDVRNVTAHPGADADPAWSPDGRRLAFSSERGGSQEIFVTRLGARNAVALTRSGANSAPDWSPDGSRIAFVHADEIRLVSARGRDETTVASGLSDPVFSPDGAGLAVADGKDVILLCLTNGPRVNLSFSAALDSAPDWRGQANERPR